MRKREMLAEMFRMQQTLNDETNGTGWEIGYNKNNRIINWRRCIYMECAELIDSFNWKHWKDINIEPNWENIKIEVVDIWHFIMSLGLEHYHANKLGSINEIVMYLIDTKNFEVFCEEFYDAKSESSMEIVNSIEHLIQDVLTNQGFHKISNDFFLIALQCGVNIDILYKLYMAKNILNKFRQDNGYKEGTYIKVWNGKEDNDILLMILDKEELSADALYQALQNEYQKVTND